MLKGTFFCVDAHTCGNPVRLVTSGHPNLTGRNMSEKRQHFLNEYDWIRKALMFEPRGHDMMSGAFCTLHAVITQTRPFYLLKPAAACPCADMAL